MRNRTKTGAAVLVVLAVAGCRGVLGLGDYEFGDPAGAGGTTSGAGGTAGTGGVGGSSEAGGFAEVGGTTGTAGGGGAGASSGTGGTAGASGSGSTGGTGGLPLEGGAGGAGAAGVGGSGGPTACAQSSGGPQLVAVAGGFCMDATEVTRDQYAAKLGSLSSVGQPGACSWNTDFTPICEWPPGTKGNHPVVCVDWCDAFAYCRAVGKRLCGKIGGGENPWANYQDATKSQWFNVCSSGGTNDYPYGDTYSSTTCNGVEAGKGGTVAVGTMSGCVSQGVFDLSGNVWEWEDSCSGKAGENDFCRLRGGSFGGSNLRCGFDNYNNRVLQGGIIGFRCCAP